MANNVSNLLQAINYQPPPAAKPVIKTKRANDYNDDAPEYSEEDLESFIPSSTDASYFEKAQDFRHIIKILRIKYLGLKPVQKTADNGASITVYQKDNRIITGINEEGVEANIRFLETRLGKHTVLSNWKEERMYAVLLDDMKAWSSMMKQDYEKFEMSGSTLIELRVLLNDLLELTYRRSIENKERGEFKPVSNEVRRVMDALGMQTQQPQQMPEYPKSMVDQVKRDTQY